jgi:hypothetical protein
MASIGTLPAEFPTIVLVESHSALNRRFKCNALILFINKVFLRFFPQVQPPTGREFEISGLTQSDCHQCNLGLVMQSENSQS